MLALGVSWTERTTMTEKEVNRMTKLQRVKIQAQMNKVQKLQSLLIDWNENDPIHPDILADFDDYDSLYDEFTHSQSFLFGMLYMVKDDPDLTDSEVEFLPSEYYPR